MAQYTTYEWKNRVSDNPTKRKLTVLSDTTTDDTRVITATVERDDTITSSGQVGTPFNATTMNSLESRINLSFQKCLECIEFDDIDNISVNSSSGFNFDYDKSDLITQCPILEFYHSDASNNDGMSCSRIFISDYNILNRISLDEIACGSDDDDTEQDAFYLKTATLNIKNNNGLVNIRRVRVRSKRLVRYTAGNFKVQKNDAGSLTDKIDVYIHKIIGYRFSKQNQ